MLALPLIAALTGTPVGNGPAVADENCAVALAEVARTATARGWQADARCMNRPSARAVRGTTLSVESLPTGAPLRSGLLALGVQTTSGTQRVWVRVNWIAPAWIALRSHAAGDLLTPQSLRASPHRWAEGVVVHAAEGPPPTGRLKRAVREGDVMHADALVPADGLMRGDRLEALVAAGGVEIRTPVMLLAHARIGERVRVQPMGRADVLDGLLVDRATVMVEGP